MEDLQFGVVVSHGGEKTAMYAQYAENLGYRMFGAGEHVMLGRPPRPTGRALTTLAVAGGATNYIQLVTSVVLVPLYHPVWLAKETSVLDNIVGGRLVLGVGVGGEHPAEFEAVGVTVSSRGRRTNETLSVIRRLWAEESVTHQGIDFSFNQVALKPFPCQKAGPPIWVAGRREPAMRRAVRFGDGWYPYLYSPQRYSESVQKTRHIAEQEGRDLTNFTWALYQFIHIDDTVERAAVAAAANLGMGYRYQGNWKDIVGQYVVLGPPDRCIERLQEYIDAGARSILLSFTSDLDTGLETVARKVIPYLRQTKSENL